MDVVGDGVFELVDDLEDDGSEPGDADAAELKYLLATDSDTATGEVEGEIEMAE